MSVCEQLGGLVTVKTSVEAKAVGTQYPLGVDELIEPTYQEVRRVRKRRAPDEPDAIQDRLKFHLKKVQTLREESWEIEKDLEGREKLSRARRELLVKTRDKALKDLQDAQEAYWCLNVADPAEREQQRALEQLKWSG